MGIEKKKLVRSVQEPLNMYNVITPTDAKKPRPKTGQCKTKTPRNDAWDLPVGWARQMPSVHTWRVLSSVSFATVA